MTQKIDAFQLPRTLSPEVRALFAKALRPGPLAEVLREAASVVLRLFNANDVLCIVDSSAGEVVEFALSHNQKIEQQFLKSLSGRWKDAGIDTFVRKELQNSLACVSYSAFSWPFPGLANGGSAEGGFSIPRDYTLLLPFSSEMTVSTPADPSFFGYLVLMFDQFPNLGSTSVELIITLPEFFSQLIAATLRAKQVATEMHVGTFAHDIKRNLLLAEEALRRLEAATAVRPGPTLAMLKRAMSRGLSLATAMLMYERLRSGKLQLSCLPICVNEMVGEALETSREQFSQRFSDVTLNLEQGLPPSALDPALFPMVVENLLENSLKYTPDGSQVQVKTRRMGEETVILEVCDHGPGLSLGEKELIFQEGYRGNAGSHSGGSGMGLYIVRQVVEAHNGRVYAAEDQDAGTSIIVEIPLLQSRQ